MIRRSAILLIFNGVEELEATASIDILRRAGVQLTVASLGDSLQVESKHGLVLKADCLFSQLSTECADLIVLPGGPGVLDWINNLQVHAWISKHAQEGKFIGAICAAPLLLESVGLLDAAHFTAHHSVHHRFSKVPAARKCMRDGKIITASGAGSAIDFALLLVEALLGEIAKEQVIRSIEYPI